jgi:hypothetical protein
MADEGEREEPEIIEIRLGDPDPDEADPCLKILFQHLPKFSDFTRPPGVSSELDSTAAHVQRNPYVRGFVEGVQRWQIASTLEFMRKFLNIRPKPKAHRGRPKGSGRKDTLQMVELWRAGKTVSQICRDLGLELDKETQARVRARITSYKRRLSDQERTAFGNARLEAKRRSR